MCMPVSVAARSEQNDMTLKRDAGRPSAPSGNGSALPPPTLSGIHLHQPQAGKMAHAA